MIRWKLNKQVTIGGVGLDRREDILIAKEHLQIDEHSMNLSRGKWADTFEEWIDVLEDGE